MNTDAAPPCALDAKANESDWAIALQLENTFSETLTEDEIRLTDPENQFALKKDTMVNPMKKLMPPPLTSAPLLRPKAILPLALHRTMELFDTRKLLRVTSVLPIVLKVEMRVNPEEPANKLIPPPFAVDPKVVADVYNRT